MKGTVFISVPTREADTLNPQKMKHEKKGCFVMSCITPGVGFPKPWNCRRRHSFIDNKSPQEWEMEKAA